MNTASRQPGTVSVPGADVISIRPDVQLHERAGDFSLFYRAHRDSIAKALTLTLGDAQLASEATDEAMTRAVQRWAKVSDYGNPQGWVYRVGLNWARSWLRRRRRERDRPVQFTPDTASLDVRDLALADALEHLTFDHRVVVVCRFFLDWSVADTALALDVPEGTVKSRLTRALANLRTHLGDER